MSVLSFARDVVRGRYYTRHPLELTAYAYARRKLRSHRKKDPGDLLRPLGIDPSVLDEASRWYATFDEVASEGAWYLGYRTGITVERGLVLYGVVRALKPRHVVETGMASGVATTFLSAALIDNGTGILYSIELPQQEAARRFQRYGTRYEPDRGPGWAIRGDMREAMGDRHVVLLEDVATSLPALLDRLGRIDVFFHDDLHVPKHMRWEFEFVWPRLEHGGVLACDDVEFAWLRFCRRHDVRDGFANIEGLGAVRKP